MRISAALPTGVHALFFESARRRRALEARLAGRLEAEGFHEVILPILDYLEPYEPMLTAASRGELYRFVDRGGDLLALRADFTPMLARLLAPRLSADGAGLPLPLRLFYRGDVVRYEEERAGRQREFYQMGAELLGVPGEQAEQEMLRLFLELLGADAAGEVSIILGFAGALDRLLLEAGGDDPDASRRLALAVARRERGAVRHAGDSCKTLLGVLENGVPDRPEDLGPEAAGRLRGLLALRDDLAARFPGALLSIDLAEFALQSRDPRLLEATGAERAYYDGLVFRAYAGRSGIPVGGGGRYDRLFRALGAEVPAVGFSLGLDRLLQAGDAERRGA
jgi:ATP phosphoribosyltransferase regulatory subunit